MTHRKKAHVQTNVLELVEEEDHPEQEKDMVIPGEHVLGAQIEERHKLHASDFLDIAFVALCNTVGMRKTNEQQIKQ